jgi:cytochrome P450
MENVEDESDDVIGHQHVVDEKDILQLKYLQAIVKETCHLHPPLLLLLPHESLKSCEVRAYHVHVESHILVSVWVVHRDFCAYENPLDFNLERFVESVVEV